MSNYIEAIETKGGDITLYVQSSDTVKEIAISIDGKYQQTMFWLDPVAAFELTQQIKKALNHMQEGDES